MFRIQLTQLQYLWLFKTNLQQLAIKTRKCWLENGSNQTRQAQDEHNSEIIL